MNDASPPDRRTVFDDVLALLTPDRLLRDPRATGEGVRVCVMDSGVERGLLQEKFRRLGQEIRPIEGGIFVAGRPEPLTYEGHQSTPHGTTVADIILSLAPRVQLYSADVFGPQGNCDVDMVIRALYWAVDVWKCKVINLSLGVAEQRLQQVQRRFQLLHAVEECYYKDVLLFAAAHNEHPLTRSYPAVFAPPLISVDKHLFDDPLQLRLQAERSDRVPCSWPRLHGTIRQRTSDKLGGPAPRRHCMRESCHCDRTSSRSRSRRFFTGCPLTAVDCPSTYRYSAPPPEKDESVRSEW